MVFTTMLKKGARPFLAHLTAMAGLMFFMSFNTAWAHKAILFAYVDGDKIKCEAKLSGGKKVRQGLIQVFDSGGNKLLEGKTDNQGRFSFVPPRQGPLKLVLQAGMGHRAEWIVSAEDMAGPDFESTAAVNRSSDNPAPGNDLHGHSHPDGNCIEPEHIQRIVESILDRKLAPLNKKLSESVHQGPKMQDIIGGIGYIIGLVGLGMYFHSRKKNVD